jgi:hypothetical protein
VQDRSRVQGHCPTCGPLTLLPRDFVCALPSDPHDTALTEFHCPLCDGTVYNPVTPQEAKLLVLLGGHQAEGPAALELTEEKSGPPVTVDELFDLHLALETICCPQAELIGSAQ